MLIGRTSLQIATDEEIKLLHTDGLEVTQITAAAVQR